LHALAVAVAVVVLGLRAVAVLTEAGTVEMVERQPQQEQQTRAVAAVLGATLPRLDLLAVRVS
jgi:DUF1009 family protein